MDKEISYEQLINSNELEPQYIEHNFDGVTVRFKTNPSLSDIFQVVTDVVDGCFLDNGEYLPELVEFLFYRSLINNFTNVTLPADLSVCYDFVMNSGNGSEMQYIFDEDVEFMWVGQLKKAIGQKLHYMADTGIATLKHKMEELFVALDNFSEQSSALFDGITPEDRDRLISAVDSIGAIDEEKLVKAFIKHDKEHSPKEDEAE